MAYRVCLGMFWQAPPEAIFGITNLLRLRMEVMGIKMCILRAFPKQRVAHEYLHGSKTLGGVQVDKRGCVSGAPSEAILALQTSSG